MNVVDSCGWLEYFGNGPNACHFAPLVEEPERLIVPSISIYEVFKRVLQQRNETDALQAVALMQQATVVDLDVTLALDAANLSATLGLPMADSIILATARAHQATVWTEDAHLQGMPDVRYVQRR